jgi:hypothetical protein
MQFGWEGQRISGLVGNPPRKYPFGRPRRIWQDNVMIYLRDIGQCSTTGVQSQGFRCAMNFYKKLYILTL